MKPFLTAVGKGFWALLLFISFHASATIGGGAITLRTGYIDSFEQTCVGTCNPTYSICYHTIFSYSNASGGSGSYIYSWETKLNAGGTWTLLTGSDSILNNVQLPSVKGSKIYYRRKATDANNPNDFAYSNEVGLGTWTVLQGSISFKPGGSWEVNVSPGTTPPMVENTSYSDHPFTWYMYQYRVGTNGTWIDAQQIMNSPYFSPPTRTTPDTVYYRSWIENDCGDPGDSGYTNTIKVIFTLPPAFTPDTISASVGVACAGTNVTFTATPTNAPAPYSLEWQTSADSLTWTPIGNTAMLTYPVTPLNYYRRVVQSQGLSTSSNVIRILPYQPGDTSLFGNYRWNMYGYDGRSVIVSGLSYKGFLTDTALNIFTSNNWPANLSPSYASNYQGCPLDTNNFTVDFKRQGFDTGIYEIKIITQNQTTLVRINGATVFSNTGVVNPPIVSLGPLGPTSKLEIVHVSKNTSDNPLQLQFIKVNPNKTSTYVDSSCNSYSLWNAGGSRFYHFTDSAGRIIAAINPNNLNLGTLAANVKHAAPGAANIPVSNIGVAYLPRYFNFKASNYLSVPFPSPVTVRLYYLLSELDDYKTATNQPWLTIPDLQVSHYDGVNQDCESYNNTTAIDTIPLASWGYVGSDGFYIDVLANSFSEFGVSGQLRPLPVKWISAAATQKGDDVLLQWQIANEINNAGYTIERGDNSVSFKAVGSVPSHNNAAHYSFTDRLAVRQADNLFYRIKQTDKDGRLSYSQVMKVATVPNGRAQLIPNPAKEYTTVVAPELIKNIVVTDVSGRAVLQKAGMSTRISINTTGLRSGTYLVQVITMNNDRQIIKLLIK